MYSLDLSSVLVLVLVGLDVSRTCELGITVDDKGLVGLLLLFPFVFQTLHLSGHLQHVLVAGPLYISAIDGQI